MQAGRKAGKRARRGGSEVSNHVIVVGLFEVEKQLNMRCEIRPSPANWRGEKF
jgi:hypothetical protein